MGKTLFKVINWEKLAVNDQFDRKFMFLTKKCSQGVVCPFPWTLYIYMTIISNISSESTVPNAMKAKFHLEPLLEDEKKVCLIFKDTWPRWLPCPYMVKLLKNILLKNQKSYDLETWHAACGIKASQNLNK